MSDSVTMTISPVGQEIAQVGDTELTAQISAALAHAYSICEPLGRGGFGSVFRAVHVNTGQSVAVKVLRPQSAWNTATTAAQIARFEREATLCAAFTHPNIVRLLDKGHTQGNLYYAIYELVPGETLRSLLDRETQLTVERTAELMAQVLDAIATAHASGVVHRDLKPANIMVTTTGLVSHVKVLDFGISTLTLEARDTAFHIVTRSHELVGTPQYCAPEQLRGEVPTPQTDIYAWGLVFLECITGRCAIPGATLAEIYHQHLSPLEIPLPSSVVGHPLGNFLRRVLRKNPAERANNAAQLHVDLKRLPLGNLVGSLLVNAAARPVSEPGSVSARAFATVERRQVTVIAVSLSLVPTTDQIADTEALDPILHDQLRLCRDSLVRYGGSITGELADVLLVMFGYPTANDTDARRAVRTVLELSEDVRRRSNRLATTHALTLELRIGVHTGPVTVAHGQAPTGITPTRALPLASAAAPNTIVVSPESRRLFEPFAVLEVGPLVSVSGEVRPVQTSLLIGERRAEALSFKPGQGHASAFIGRAAELGQIAEHIALSSTQKQVHGALITGEAGIGKSHLVREILQKARADGRELLECRCLSEHQNVALWPVLPLLRHRLCLQGVADSIAGDLMVAELEKAGLDPVRFIPILSIWLSIRLPAGFESVQMAPYRQRERLLEAMVALLSQPNGDKSPVILFEDLHWADPTTLDLIGQLLDAQCDSPPYLLCTGRPELAVPWQGSTLLRLNLDRLSPTDAEALALHVWDGASSAAAATWNIANNADLEAPFGVNSKKPPPAVLAAIIARADGIPLFIEEVTRMVAERGAHGLDVQAIPITLRDSLSGRLDSLGEARKIVQTAAVLGREFDAAVLLSTADEDDLAVQRALDKLTSVRLIYRRRWLSGSTYVFRHALIQEAAYDSMPRDVRRQIHARVVAVLEKQFATSPLCTPAVLARHHAGAGQFEAAVRRGTEAAQISVDKSSNAEAIAEVDQTTTWLAELSASVRADAELRLNGIKLQALMSMEGWASENVRALAERSRGLLPRSSETRNAFAILFGLFLYYRVSSQHDATRRVIDELVEQADRTGDVSLQCVAATANGATYYGEGKFLEAEVWLNKVLDNYDPKRDQKHGSQFGMDSRAWSAALLALVEWGVGRTQRAFELADEAIAWAREIKHIPSLAIALLYASQVHHMDGDKAKVRERTTELLEWSKTYGLPALEGFGTALACWAEDDKTGVEKVINKLLALNCNLKMTYYGSLLVDIEVAAGRYREAIGQIDNWLQLGISFDDRTFEAELTRRRAVYEMELPSPDKLTIEGSLIRARELARERGMFRVEAAAIEDQIRLFGETEELRARRAEIYAAFPELSPDHKRTYGAYEEARKANKGS